MQELQGQWKRLRQNNATIGDFKVKWYLKLLENKQLLEFGGFMPGLISLGRLKKQQNLTERSCTEAALTKRPRIQAEERSSVEIFYLGRRVESKKGLRIDQNILLNIPIQRARLKEAKIIKRRDPKPMHVKFTWSVLAFPPRDIVYEQANQLSGLRDKPITQQDALPRSEGQSRYLPRQDLLSLFETSPLSSCLVRSSKHHYRRS
ncbi:hypothetical protein V6N13_032073 [Hibiscus sabdariffa]